MGDAQEAWIFHILSDGGQVRRRLDGGGVGVEKRGRMRGKMRVKCAVWLIVFDARDRGRFGARSGWRMMSLWWLRT